MRHFLDIEDAKDKAIHLLYAGFVCGFYQQTMEECIEEFGEDIVKEAENEFNKNYRDNCSVI